MDRRRALVRGEGLPDRCRGAALFADVSGFSKLAAELADELGARRAPEALLDRMNPVLETLIGVLHAYAGSVVAFAGDSITCWFDDAWDGRTQEGDGARRALACGLAMQLALEQLHDPSGFGPPALKVAIACGKARRFLVGDPSILQIDALAGATIRRMVQGERIAASGEVLVSAEVVATAGANVAEWRGSESCEGSFAVVASQRDVPPKTPWPALELSVLEESALSSWVLHGVFSESGVERPADLRAVLPIFAAFDGIDYDDDDRAGSSLDSLTRWAQQVLRSAGGALLQLIIGDKGSYLYGVVGAPGAQPDAPRRAARAALELRFPPPLLGGPLRVGMTHGRAWTGVAGAPARRCYTVMGEEVNLAARLMQAAQPGQALVSAHVTTSAIGYRFESRPAVPVKGRLVPLAVFELIGQSDETEQTSAALGGMFGRDAELARLLELLGQVGAGAARVCFVEAAAGMGKSLLARELLARARAVPIRCVIGSGDAIERDSPLRAWRGIFRDLFDAPRGGDPEDLQPRVIARVKVVAPELEDLLSLLNPLLATRFEETDLTRWMSDDVRADNTRELSLRLLAALRGSTAASDGTAAPSPLLLLFDDAHWIDSASWALLRRVWQELGGILALILRRPETEDERPASSEYRQLAEAEHSQHIVLEALTREEIIAIARARLGVTTIPERLADFLVTRSSGHPLLSDQLSAALLEAGHILLSGGSCSLAQTFDESTVELPDSVEGVIAARLDRLNGPEHDLLRLASVLGLSFDAQTIEALTPDAGAPPASLLARLAELDFVSQEPDGYSFRHPLVREVTYTRLLYAKRRHFHRAAARYFEDRHAADLTPWHGVLAHHFVAGEEHQRATHHLGKSGEIALRAGAFRETTVYLERALELGGAGLDQRTRAQWTRRLGNAWYRLGALPVSTRYAEEAVSVFDRPIPKQGSRLLSGVLGELLQQTRNRFGSERRLHQAPEERRPELRSAVLIYQNLSEVYYLAGLQGPSVYAALRQVNVAEQAGISDELAEAYGVLSIILGLVGLRSLSNRYEALAEKVVDQLQNPRARAMFLHQRSLSSAAFGEFDRVLADETSAVSVFDRLGEIGRKRDALGLLGTTEYLASRYDSAERVLEELLATRTGTDRFVQEIWGSAWLGGVALQRGQLDLAVERFQRSIELLDRNTVGLMEVSCRGFLGLASMRLGDEDTARTNIDAAFDLIAKAKGRPAGHISLDGYVAVVEAYSEWARVPGKSGAERQRATERAAKGAAWLLGFAKAFPIGEPAARLFSGLLAAHAGDKRRATREWTRGLAAARRLGMAFEEGRLLAAMAQILTGSERRARASEALERLQKIGAHYHARAAESLL